MLPSRAAAAPWRGALALQDVDNKRFFCFAAPRGRESSRIRSDGSTKLASQGPKPTGRGGSSRGTRWRRSGVIVEFPRSAGGVPSIWVQRWSCQIPPSPARTTSPSRFAPLSRAAPPLGRRVVALAALALVALFLATVKVTVTGGAYGLPALPARRAAARGEGTISGWATVRGSSGSRLRGHPGDLASGGETLPRLELEWDEAEGAGIVTNHLADGRIVQTLFGRYVDDDGRTPHGLFVGGALPRSRPARGRTRAGLRCATAATGTTSGAP